MLVRNQITSNQRKSNWWKTFCKRFSLKRDESPNIPQKDEKLILSLSEEDSKIIYRAMMNPPEPSDELLSLFE
ncbi:MULTISPECIES: hypothetical protein [unclassified Spirulina]|uniref:hypothetical protein n=1 Tax=unclassified Spirulina TaxID=2684457 RepID=UPI00194F8C9E|nr:MULTISPECIES: hypothetical protein [Spirulina]